MIPDQTHVLASSKPPYKREITVKTLCQMEAVPRTSWQRMELAMWRAGRLRTGYYNSYPDAGSWMGIVGPSHVSLNEINRDLALRAAPSPLPPSTQLKWELTRGKRKRKG